MSSVGSKAFSPVISDIQGNIKVSVSMQAVTD
jgi:hypothetical protein